MYKNLWESICLKVVTFSKKMSPLVAVFIEWHNRNLWIFHSFICKNEKSQQQKTEWENWNKCHFEFSHSGFPSSPWCIYEQKFFKRNSLWKNNFFKIYFLRLFPTSAVMMKRWRIIFFGCLAGRKCTLQYMHSLQ